MAKRKYLDSVSPYAKQLAIQISRDKARTYIPADNAIINKDDLKNTGWEFKSYYDLKPDDPLYSSITDVNQPYLVDAAGDLVSKSRINKYKNGIGVNTIIDQPQSNNSTLKDIRKAQDIRRNRDFDTQRNIGLGLALGTPLAVMTSLAAPEAAAVGWLGGEIINSAAKKLGIDWDNSFKDPNGRFYGQFVNPFRLAGNIKGGIIGNNLKNRNLFIYKYLEPWSYQNKGKRALNVAKHILKDNKVPDDKNPIRKDPMYVDIQKLQGVYRDEAFRKYLGLSENTPLYVKNPDGTYSYNLNYLRQGDKEVFVPTYLDGRTDIGYDTFTGNGASVGLNVDSKNHTVQINDVWDINPFSRMNTINVEPSIRRGVDKLYKGLYPALYKIGTKRGEFGYKYLGGKRLNTLRNPVINDNISKGSKIINTILNKAVSPIKNWDAKRVLGGKNFVLKQEIPYRTLTDDEVDAIWLRDGFHMMNGQIVDFSGNKVVDFQRVGPNGLILK